MSADEYLQHNIANIKIEFCRDSIGHSVKQVIQENNCMVGDV